MTDHPKTVDVQRIVNKEIQRYQNQRGICRVRMDFFKQHDQPLLVDLAHSLHDTLTYCLARLHTDMGIPLETLKLVEEDLDILEYMEEANDVLDAFDELSEAKDIRDPSVTSGDDVPPPIDPVVMEEAIRITREAARSQELNWDDLSAEVQDSYIQSALMDLEIAQAEDDGILGSYDEEAPTSEPESVASEGE